MKVVFVHPRVGFRGHTWEALGVGYLVSYLKKYFPRSLEVAFYSGFYDDDETIVDACQDAKIIGFSCTSPQYRHGLELARRIKNERNCIVFGGPHPSALPALVLRDYGVDFVVRGEGERAVLQIVRDVGKPVLQPKRVCNLGFIEDLDSIPFPDRKTIKNERNIQQAYEDNGVRTASILSSRGCPYGCTFCCSHTVWGRRIRFRSPSNILDEVVGLTEDWKIDFLKFADDTFTVNRERLVSFCKLKLERSIDIPYGCNAHINTIDEEVLKHLQQSHCQELWYGVESGSPKILRDMCKNTDIERIKRVFKMTRDYGIKTRAYFLLGMPNETLDDIKKTEELCDELQPDMVGFTLLAPYPGSEHFDYDTMKDWDWSTVDEYDNDYVHTKTLTNDQLKGIQRRLVEKYQKTITFRQRLLK